MVNVEYREAMAETLYVLRNSEENVIAKIPLEIIKFLKENSLSSYEFKINYEDEIEKTILKPKTRAILALLYRDYLCTEEERISYNKKLQQNENSYQKELKKIYNNNDIFTKRNNTEKSILPVKIEDKQNLFQRIIIKVKRILGLTK